MGRGLSIRRLISGIAGAVLFSLLWTTAGLAELDSSGEYVEIPLPPQAEIESDPLALPSVDATGALDPDSPRTEIPLTSLDEPIGEHPVYHLRPEPYSEEGALLLSLNDLLDLAVANNLGLRGQELLVEKQHYSVDRTYYVFDPSFGANLNYSKRNQGGVRAAQQGGIASSESLSAGFDFTLPRVYGDSFTFGYSVDRGSFSLIGDDGTESPTTYGSGVDIGYNRPLLRGAGRYLNLIPRYIASNNLLLSYDQLDDTVRQLKKQVLDGYFLAVAARESIEVRHASLELALAQLVRAVERYKAGLSIQADVLQAENSVLVQRAQLLTAQETYESLLDNLTQLIGVPVEVALAVDAEGALLGLADASPGDDLPEDLWTLVLANSYDLKSLNTQLANLRLNRDVLKDNLRPQLDLALSYGRTGEDDALGAAVGGLENESYQVGLNFSTTPGNRVAKTDIAQNELDLASIELQIQDTELQLKTRLRDLQRDISLKLQQIELAESNVVVARQTVDIMQERNNVGLATTLDVIEAQEDLLLAELALLQAKVDYQQAYREILLLAGLI